MTERKVQFDSPLVELPSGVAIQPSKILFIGRKELNQFVVFMEHSQAAPHIDGTDMDALRDYGIVQRLVEAKGDAPAIKVAK
jgi:hypothetical protein